MADRRTTKWHTIINPDTSLTAGSQVGLDLSAGLEQANRRGSTVVRLILDLHLRPGTLSHLYSLSWGVIVMNLDAVAASAFSDPEAEGDDADWLIRGRSVFESSNLSDSTQWGRVTHDVRSARVMRSAQSQLVLVMHNGGPSTMTHLVFTRALFMLP